MDRLDQMIGYILSLEQQWYFDDLNIDKVNCLGVALCIIGAIPEPNYETLDNWIDKLAISKKERGVLSIFFKGKSYNATICLGGDNYFYKYNIGEPCVFAKESELMKGYDDLKFYTLMKPT